MNWHVAVLIGAVIAFGVDAFKTWIAPGSQINWTALGFCLVTVSLLV